MIRRPPRPPIKMMQPIALDLANSVTLLKTSDKNTMASAEKTMLIILSSYIRSISPSLRFMTSKNTYVIQCLLH